MIFESEVTMEQRKYRVKMSWIFNLESMQDRLWCIEYDIEEGKIQLPIEVAGKQRRKAYRLYISYWRYVKIFTN
jgi:hypothetical protein